MDSTTNAPSSGFRETLRHPDFARLLAATFIAAFGDRINQIALLSYAFAKGNISKYTADIMFWALMPSVVLGPFTVALMDRWDRQRTMFISDVARAGLVLSLPVLLLFIKHHYVVYAVVFFVGIFSAFFSPSRMAIMPNLLPRGLLMPANAMVGQAGTVATLLGVPIGGWIVDQFGRNPSFVVNSATYLVSALLVLSLNSRRAEEPAHPPMHPVDDLLNGVRFIRGHRPILFYVVFFGMIQCVVAVFIVAFFEYGGKVLMLSETGTSWLFGAMGVGMAAGAVWMVRHDWIGEWLAWPMFMLMGTGADMLILSRVHHPWAAALVLAVTGACAVMVLVPMDTYLQKHVGDEFRGRVFAARGVLVGIAFLVSLQFSKAFIKQLGVVGTLQLLGVAAILLGVVGLVLGRSLGAAKKMSPAPR